ncbi:hypothetical protein DOTSEDRAFT_41559 [Dothistroma septosporum NZE10]|uniref:Uncharacterized protein n=1 Tax=Dothistroma septosporum (strain NZE10 / CBS 128990) TaxID=675120 RepID=N1PX95_DOTSN|nr:hypothetical protein DOTSEDRAFT_41559 [Dothistroma septosporum NZE10]
MYSYLEASPAALSTWSQKDDGLRVSLAERALARRTPRKLNATARSLATAESMTAVDRETTPPEAVKSSPDPRLVDPKSATQANIRSPRAPPKLERRSIEDSTPASPPSLSVTMLSAEPHRAMSRAASPSSAKDTCSKTRFRTAIHLSPADAAARLSLSTRGGKQGLTITVNGVAPNPPFVSPSLGKENRPLSRANLNRANRLRVIDDQQKSVSTEPQSIVKATANHSSQVNGSRGANNVDTDNGSTVSVQSRKRKMQDRTPKKQRNSHRSVEKAVRGPANTSNGAARPVLGRSPTSHSSAISHTTSRSGSVASGPRKLSRVGSVVKVRSGDGGTTSIDGKSAGATHQPGSAQTRRRPPKLRVGSQQS